MAMKMNLYLFGALSFLTLVVASSEMLDFVTVYRIPGREPYLLAEKEYHKLTNTLGMLLRTSKYKFTDSVKGMNSLGCMASETSCKWKRSSDWKIETYYVSEENYFTLDIDDMETSTESSENTNFQIDELGDTDVTEEFSGNIIRSCSTNNGGCQVFCSMSQGVPRCSCPSGFTLIGSSCYGDSHNVIHTNHSEISATKSTHLIIAPPNTTIKLEINNHCQCRLHIQEFNKFGQIINSNAYDIWNNFKIVSTSNILRVSFAYHNGYSSEKRVFSYVVSRQLLTLKSTSGELDLSILPKSHNLCVSVIYKPAMGNVSLVLRAKQNTQLYEASKFQRTIVKSWNITQFEISLRNRNLVNLSLSVFGTNTVIHSISGCSPNGKHDVTSAGLVSPPFPALEREAFLQEEGGVKDCFNGGVYNEESGRCNCLPGFIGNKCDVGCGPNKFGNDCQGRCANFGQNCSGMIFCKRNMPCHCAPGFTGRYCNSNCIPGFYGPSCKFPCGNCNGEECNIYTGICDANCLPGFYPPTCLDTYKYIAQPPNVTYRHLTFVTLTANTSITRGRGDSKFYQVQYKKVASHYWIELEHESLLSEVIITNITGLGIGMKYVARIILFSDDGNSYQTDLIPFVEFNTLCNIPESREYNLQISNVTATSFAVSWKYDTQENDCPIIGYEINLRKDWEEVSHKVSLGTEEMTFNNLIPGDIYKMDMQGLTNFGRTSFSDTLQVEINGTAPENVHNLHVSSAGSRKLFVSWSQPITTGGTIKQYILEYKCIKFLACTESCTYSKKHLVTTGTSVTLDGLHPHTQYLVKVAGKVNYVGPYTFAYGATEDSVPQLIPSASDSPIISSTNSTLKVRWLPPESCANLNGYMVGYHYELLSSDNKTLLVGNTSHTNKTFKDLTPQTNYVVRVYVVSSGGWNPDHKLDIDAATAPTVPEAVQNLTIYKRGRRMLGIRWALPHETYGDIKSFSVSIQNGKDKEVTEIISPQRCIPWPELFCHTSTNLIPNRQYSVTVRARNTYVDADGQSSTLITQTSEGAPGSPVSLTVTDRNSSSVSIQWEPPFMFNGVLRSFLINVEQVDSANSSECCEYYPVRELAVKEERKHYYYEASDLKPASKYIISVSPKTLAIGMTSNITVNTPPEYPELEQPILIEPGRVKLAAPLLYTGVESSYLLLMLSTSEHPTAHMWDEEVENLLSAAVNGSFYVVKEFQYEELVEQPEVSVGEGGEPREGALGMLQDPVLAPGEYRVGLAAVLDYGGAKTVGFMSSDPFSIEADY